MPEKMNSSARVKKCERRGGAEGNRDIFPTF